MTHQQKLEAIRKACVKANPGRDWVMLSQGGGSLRDAPVRLADVLLMLGEKYAFDGSGSLMEREFGTSSYDSAGCSGRWNLRKDSLEEQSEETVAFIYDLLK